MKRVGVAPPPCYLWTQCFARAIEHWRFQQAVDWPQDHPRPPRSRRAWYNVNGLPPAPSPQVENPDLPKIQRQFPFRNLHARIPITRLRELEAGTQVSLSVINYAATYSHAITHAKSEVHTLLQASLADTRLSPPGTSADSG